MKARLPMLVEATAQNSFEEHACHEVKVINYEFDYPTFAFEKPLIHDVWRRQIKKKQADKERFVAKPEDDSVKKK